MKSILAVGRIINNNSDPPKGWSMSDDLAKRISKLVNKKLDGPEDDLKEALNDLARDIALIEPNPIDWWEGDKCV